MKDDVCLALLLVQGDGKAQWRGRDLVRWMKFSVQSGTRFRIKFLSATRRPRQELQIYPRNCSYHLEWANGVAEMNNVSSKCWFDTMPREFELVVTEAGEQAEIVFVNGEEGDARNFSRSWGGNHAMHAVPSPDGRTIVVYCNGYSMKKPPRFKDLVFELERLQD